MISFKTYLFESTKIFPGNYVCAHCTDPVVPDHLMPKTGKRAVGKSHITLIYSKESDVDQKTIQNLLALCPPDLDLTCHSVDCFDALPKEGERDENKATLVLKITHPVLDKIHDSLKSLGMQHSYPEFSAHVTLAYDVDREEARQCMFNINNWIGENNKVGVSMTGFESKPIDEDWSKKL